VKKILIFIGTILMLVVLILSPFLMFSWLVKVKVVCRSQQGGCPKELESELKDYESKNLATAREGIEKLLKEGYLVSDFSCQFKLPDFLYVDLVVRKPLFALRENGSESLALVDKDGNVLSMAKDSALPAVSIDQKLPSPGQNVGGVNLFALDLVEGIYEMYQVKEGIIQDDTLLVELPNQIRVIFPLGDKNRETLLGSLRLIYSQITSGDWEGRFSQIDLRFKNPVLR
jgi:cell division septal protein FtsQ